MLLSNHMSILEDFLGQITELTIVDQETIVSRDILRFFKLCASLLLRLLSIFGILVVLLRSKTEIFKHLKHGK